MNELMIPGCYIYMRTKTDNCETAVDELFRKLESLGLEIYFEEAHLRDEEMEDIDVIHETRSNLDV